MRRQELQDATGVLEVVRNVGITRIRQATTPTDSVSGYAPGCEWINTSGTLGSVLYVNVGTFASSNWANIA